MGWRSVVISQPAHLSLGHGALLVRQGEQRLQVPLEDISVLLIDNPQVTLSAQLLSACADQRICALTVGADHHPNGVFLPFVPHSRALKLMRAQLALAQPTRKRLQQALVRQKILNQAAVLAWRGDEPGSRQLRQLAAEVRSGDAGHAEGQAAQRYFVRLFGAGFRRRQGGFHNAALNYGYAVLRAALARSLVCHGLLPAFGLFHGSEQNAFNLADDLLEPYRGFVDQWLLAHFAQVEPGMHLQPADKATLVGLLHRDTVLLGAEGACSLLTAVEQTVASLGRAVLAGKGAALALPCLHASLHYQGVDDEP